MNQQCLKLTAYFSERQRAAGKNRGFLADAMLDVFDSAPASDLYLLVEDGAGDALEHRASVTIGIRSADLGRNPRASLPELAHEFFHIWNLVAIHPDDYGTLSYQRPRRTAGLWWGEGVTLYYADALPRRAGLVDTSRSRLDHLAGILSDYYAAPWSTRVCCSNKRRRSERNPKTRCCCSQSSSASGSQTPWHSMPM